MTNVFLLFKLMIHTPQIGNYRIKGIRVPDEAVSTRYKIGFVLGLRPRLRGERDTKSFFIASEKES